MARRTTRKTTYRRRPQQRVAKSPFKWLVCGMLLGLILPGYFLLKNSHKTTTEIIAHEQSEVVNEQSLALKQHTHKSAPKKAEKISPHSHYDFYNLLPQEDTEEKSTFKEHNDKSYTLQVGNARTYADADQLKAQLALIGLEHLTIDKVGHGFVISVGPFNNKNDALKIKKQLADNDVSAKIMKTDNP